MKKRLTKVEELEVRHPGLADQLRVWFSQGIFVRQIPELITEQYKVPVSESAISSFRRKRWVPEQELLREKKLNAIVALEVAREQEIRASMASRIPEPRK
jgi:hypothetical protein